MEHQGEQKLVGKIEALLFYYGEPISMKKISELLGAKESECTVAVESLRQALEGDAKRGLMLAIRGKDIQLVTRPDFHEIGERVMKDEFREELSPAGMETLSLIAYLGPISRPDVDYIRGVNSTFTLRNLLVRGLLDRKPHPEKPNMFQYEVSFSFLKHMGIARIEDLPEYEKYKDALTRFDLEIAPQP